MKKWIVVLLAIIAFQGALAAQDIYAPFDKKPGSPVYFGVGAQVSTNVYPLYAADPALIPIQLVYLLAASLTLDVGFVITDWFSLGLEIAGGYLPVFHALLYGANIFARFDIGSFFLQPLVGYVRFQPLMNPTAVGYIWAGLKIGFQVGMVDLFLQGDAIFAMGADAGPSPFEVRAGIGATVHFLKR